MKSTLKSLMSVAAAALALTSCSTDATEDVIVKGGLKTLQVNASIEQTRTLMADNHQDLQWSESDTVLLYIGADTTKADAKIIKPAEGGTIKNVEFADGDNVYANYSLDNVKFSKGAMRAEIKIDADQKQSAANVFAGENLPMFARGTIQNGAVNLTFKPVGCVLVFNVYDLAGMVSKDEKISSIKFETTTGCCGFDNCNLTDLTKETLDYEPYYKNTSATVTLGTPAAIGTAKPTDTRIGENQVYLVVAPVNYTAATFTVTTNVDTYTFTTKSGINCSESTARVVNLNLAKAPEMQPSIEVPTVKQQESAGGTLDVTGIVFKHFTAEEIAQAEVGVYGDEALTEPIENGWLTISGKDLANGSLTCNVAANTGAERTAYIGIKCVGKQAAIAVTQVAEGGSTDRYFVKVTETLADWTGDYLIVYEGADKTYALNGNLEDPDTSKNTIEVTKTDKGILLDDKTNPVLIKISKIGDTDGYTLQVASNVLYLYSTKDGNDLLYSKVYGDAEKYPNTIRINSDGSADIQSSSKAYLRYNKTSGQERFRYYNSGKYTNQQPIQLYKLQ